MSDHRLTVEQIKELLEGSIALRYRLMAELLEARQENERLALDLYKSESEVETLREQRAHLVPIAAAAHRFVEAEDLLTRTRAESDLRGGFHSGFNSLPEVDTATERLDVLRRLCDEHGEAIDDARSVVAQKREPTTGNEFEMADALAALADAIQGED